MNATLSMLPTMLLFGLVPVGGVLLYVGIRRFRTSFFGPLLAELPMDGPAVKFTIATPGTFGVWIKGPFFTIPPLDAFHLEIVSAATGSAVPLAHSRFRPNCNDGRSAWLEFRRFTAAAGAYRLDVRLGPAGPMLIDRLARPLLRILALRRATAGECAIQIRESESIVWLLAGILLFIVAGWLMIGGLIGGILMAVGIARGADDLPDRDPAATVIAVVRRLGPEPERQTASIVIDRGALTPERAAELASSHETLRLDGLESIAADVARALEPHAGLLSLPGVRRVDDETAAILARHRGNLKMEGLERIDSAALFTKLLGTVPQGGDTTWHLFVQERLESLTDAQVEVIAAHRFSAILIPKVALSERQAEMLATSASETICVGADNLPVAALHRLADRPGELGIVAQRLSDEQARILAGRRGALIVDVAALTESAAAILKARAGKLEIIPPATGAP